MIRGRGSRSSRRPTGTDSPPSLALRRGLAGALRPKAGAVWKAAVPLVFSAFTATAATPPSKLLDVYASRTGDEVTVHIVASGDISGFKTTRKLRADSYTLTIDVPALPPLDKKYDVRAPLTRKFELWPMKLGASLGSRVVMELETAATSVIGAEGPNRIFIRLSKASTPRLAQKTPPPEHAVADVSVEPTPAGTPDVQSRPSAEDHVAPAPDSTPTEDPSFFSLFPVPSGRTAVPLPPSGDVGSAPEESGDGLHLGRFRVLPMIEANYVRGTNLLLTGPAIEDSALFIRGRTAFELAESENSFKLVYEARYRNFQTFQLQSKLSHFLDLKSAFDLGPRLYVELGDHFVRGSFESEEIDPGHELALNTDPFMRNDGNAALTVEASGRLGIKLSGRYNWIRFLNPSTTFFDYRTTDVAASFLYDLSPLTTIFGEYVRSYTPEPAGRPGAGSTGDSVYLGLSGEITPRLGGRVQGGYSLERYGSGLRYRGLVARAELTRQLTEQAAVSVSAGRQNFLSAFAGNVYYTSNHAEAGLVLPIARRFRLVAGGSVFDNQYPVAETPGGVRRRDFIWAGRGGILYSVTPFAFLRFDYRHESRNSKLDLFDYRNDSFVVLVGLGYANDR